MGEIWGPVIGSLGFTALIVLPIIVNKIIKFKLEIAKINAETTIKSEEIRARNQLEIEKLVKQEQNTTSNEYQKLRSNFSSDEEFYNKPDRVKTKL